MSRASSGEGGAAGSMQWEYDGSVGACFFLVGDIHTYLHTYLSTCIYRYLSVSMLSMQGLRRGLPPGNVRNHLSSRPNSGLIKGPLRG